jgi:hypothetical protein
MNFIRYLHALFHHQPTTVLTLTNAQASLRELYQEKSYATLTPIPYLINDNNDLVSGFQLRTFIESHLLATARHRFSIIVQLPPINQNSAQRLATQVATILLSLSLPAYVCTQETVSTQDPATLVCVFFQHPIGRRPRFVVAGLSLVAALASGLWWYMQPAPLPPTHTPPLPDSKPIKLEITGTKLNQYRYHAIIAALLSHAPPALSLQRLQKNNKRTQALFFALQPALLTKAQQLFSKATHDEWQLTQPRYKAGFPPLYYATCSNKSTVDTGHVMPHTNKKTTI